ncbi:MAG: ATP-binding cassette domain-containing protein [Lachnospiraceae bacterium]|nr:ATP-binding cassette domain-containing protein [Lachnospiraceae bacterium]
MSLEVKNLRKKYGEKVVLEDLSFTMDKPGVYALLGTNGAGKTTSIRMILGMLVSDGGSVSWNGQPLDPLKINVGYLAEERGLYPKVTLMDQLLYFADLKNMPRATAKKRIAELAKRLEVEEYLYPKKNATKAAKRKKKEKPKTAEQLSKGNQQKIQLLVALLSDPELIVLDEPLSGLDPVNADLFKEIIREEIAAGKYMIMSSHQMATIEEFCEDVTILHHGKAVLQGNLNEIKKSYGRVHLQVKCEQDILPILEEMQMNIEEATPDGYAIKVEKEEEATELLKRLLYENITIIRYELREPSLHEIFVEKVGEPKDTEVSEGEGGAE